MVVFMGMTSQYVLHEFENLQLDLNLIIIEFWFTDYIHHI